MEEPKIHRTTLDIPIDLYKRFKISCVNQEATMKDVLIYSICKWIEKVEGKSEWNMDANNNYPSW